MGMKVRELLSRGAAGIIDETEDYYWVRVLNLFDMYVMKDDKSLTPCLVHDGFWESWITEYLIKQDHYATVFYDVGSNCGYYSLLMYRLGAMVSSFEPNPAYFKMMEATIERNGWDKPSFRRSQYAISDKHGTETLWIPKELHGSASFTEMDQKWEAEPLEVKTAPLDHLGGCGNYIVKIDAEGAEEKVWDGMIDSLKKRIGHSQVLLEYTPGAYSDEFLDKLEDYAPLHWINGNGEAEPVTREWIYAQTDWVMLILDPYLRR